MFRLDMFRLDMFRLEVIAVINDRVPDYMPVLASLIKSQSNALRSCLPVPSGVLRRFTARAWYSSRSLMARWRRSGSSRTFAEKGQCLVRISVISTEGFRARWWLKGNRCILDCHKQQQTAKGSSRPCLVIVVRWYKISNMT